MDHAIIFNGFESGTQASDMLICHYFHKISITKCSRREPQKNVQFPDSHEPNTQIASQNMPKEFKICQTG